MLARRCGKTQPVTCGASRRDLERHIDAMLEKHYAEMVGALRLQTLIDDGVLIDYIT